MVHNFKVGGLEKYGLGYEDLKEEFPNLVYCAISGYGQTGPLANVPGHDINYVARAGVLGLFGPANGLPAKPGSSGAITSRSPLPCKG